MPAAAADKTFPQTSGEWLDANRVQTNQGHVTQRCGQLSRIFEFLLRSSGHRRARIEKHTDRHPRLDLEHLEKQLLQAHVGSPVDRAQIVTVMEVAMIQEF